MVLGAQARVSDVAPARSCASVERHGACPSAGSFSVRLEGPATLWGALRHISFCANCMYHSLDDSSRCSSHHFRVS